MTVTTILIGGPSGSGKSSISHKLQQQLQSQLGPDCINIIQEDNYYRDQSHLDFDTRCLQNYDHPDAFEYELLLQHLQQLQQGKSIDMPVYEFSQHTRSKTSTTINPSPILIVEGILLLSQDELRQFSDLSIYIDTPMDICLIRRLERDIQQRGRDMASVLSQYQQTVRPMAEAFVLPSRIHANMILSGVGDCEPGLEVLCSHLATLIQNN